MNGNSNHYWKKSFNTTRINVVIDDPLQILDTYITDFVSPYRINVFDKIKDGFVEQNDESHPRMMANEIPVIAPGVCGEELDTPTLNPQIDQEYWKDRAREIPTIWSPTIGEDDTLPPMPFADCDPLGLHLYWRPGASPFRDSPPQHPSDLTFNPMFGRQDDVKDGNLYRFPYEVPPYGVEPKYINEQTGEEIYYYPPGENGHWWIRKRLPGGKFLWHFRVPSNNPESEEGIGYNNPGGNNWRWLSFEPCYGVPVCFKFLPPYMDEFNSIPPIRSRPFFPRARPDIREWNKPQENPPDYDNDNPYGIPILIIDGEEFGTTNCPICPLGNSDGTKWRPIRIPGKSNEDGSPEYYPRSWDPILGPTYIAPDGEQLPVNPDFIDIRPDQQPCNPDGPGFDPNNKS